MTSTSQETLAKGDASSEPAKQPEAPKEARQVPLDALAEARQKARAAEERIAALESELAQTKKTPPPAAAVPPQPELERIGKELAEIKQKERVRELTVELGLVDDKQAQAVLELVSKNPDLTSVEALELAAKRKPDVFKERGQPGFDPRIHGSMRPHAGSSPQPKESEYKQRLAAAKKATGNDKHRLLNNIVGGMAAKAMGWNEHKKLTS